VLVSDHFVPAATTRHVEILDHTRGWAHDNGISNFFEATGILHNLVLERGLVRPGELLVGADSHTTSAGAMGAVAVAVGSTELATVMATGQVWLRVPETVRIDLDGALAPLVDLRDVTMRLLGDFSADFAIYRALEYGGGFVSTLSLEERLVLANQGIEMGAKNAVVEPSPLLETELVTAGRAAAGPLPRADGDARYAERHRYDAHDLVPLVAMHPSPDNVRPAAEIEPTPVDRVWIGSCTGGRLADLQAAATILKDRAVAAPTMVTPSTQEIHRAAVADGTIGILLEAGCHVQPPGCGACAGIHSGVTGDGEVVFSTGTRNFPGRMGSRSARIHIGSAFTAAAVAVAGRIVDPRDVMAERAETPRAASLGGVS